MEQYIPKSALVAKINELLNLEEEVSYLDKNSFNSGRWKGLTIAKAIINTLKVKEVQEPTASDRGMAEEIIVNLKRVENDYRINLTKQMEWLRNIVKKGEEV